MSSKGVVEGRDLGGVINHIKAFKLHLFKRRRDFLVESPKFKHLK